MSSKKRKENLEKLARAINTLQTIVDNVNVPRNIRKIVKESITMLQDEKLSPAVRAANVISMLDEISQDPNMPSFTRVTLWSAVSTLEGIKE
ncbi:MAG: UPF0147 family protein [Nitrososphaerales archaeon]